MSEGKLNLFFDRYVTDAHAFICLESEKILTILDQYTRTLYLTAIGVISWILVFLVVLKNMDKIAKEKKKKGKLGEIDRIIRDIENKRNL